MKNKNLLWVVIVIIALVLIYWGVVSKRDDGNNENATTTTDSVDSGTATTSQTNTPTGTTKPATNTTPTVKTGVVKKFTTVLAAVASGTSVKCTNPTGTVTTTFYISGERIRRDDVTISGTTYTVATPQAIFSWRKGSTQETDYYGAVATNERNALLNTSLVGVSCVTANLPSSTFARP